jgi:hypothetical protein
MVQKGLVTSAAFHPDRCELYTCSDGADGGKLVRSWGLLRAGSGVYKCPMRRTASDVAGKVTTMCVDPSGTRVFGWGGGTLHCWSTSTLQLLWAVEDGLQEEDRPVLQLSFDPASGLLSGMTVGRTGVRLWASPLVGGLLEHSAVESGDASRLFTGVLPAGMGVSVASAMEARGSGGDGSSDGEGGRSGGGALGRLASLCGFLAMGPREVGEPGEDRSSGAGAGAGAGAGGLEALDGGWDAASVHSMASSLDASQSLSMSLTLGPQRSMSTVGR